MTDWTWVGKIVGDFGVAGVMLVALVLLYRLADKWAALFLEAQKSQAAAMASLAMAVKEGQSDQREVLIAVRVLADRIEAQKGYLEAIERNCREKGVCGRD